MFKTVTLSWELANRFVAKGFTNTNSMFVWVKDDKDHTSVQLRKLAKRDEIVAPAFSANDMARITSNVCRKMNRYFSMTIGAQIINVADSLSESLLELIEDDEEISGTVTEAIVDLYAEDNNSTVLTLYTKEAHQQMFDVLEAALKNGNSGSLNGSTIKVNDYSIVGRSLEEDRKKAVTVIKDKQQLLVLVADMDISNVHIAVGNDTILAEVANMLVIAQSDQTYPSTKKDNEA